MSDTNTTNYDYFIVGQGLAGTLLTHFLQRRGYRCLVIDQDKSTGASRVAAGLINPITGRRYVKSWRVDELIPFAEQTYRDLEAQLDVSIYHPRNILRSLFNHREESDWLARSAEPGYEAYVQDSIELGNYEKFTVAPYAYGEVTHSAQVDLSVLKSAFRQKLKADHELLDEPFDYEQLAIRADGLSYGSYRAERIVFCEGYQATVNPFFKYLPFGGAKGEVLLVRLPYANFEKVLKHRVFIVPMQNDLYWIGATYDWKFADEQPTADGGNYLRDRLDDILRTPYEVVEHRAAVRPTVKDRRPFLGVHPDFERLFLFNGLGTKGASLGPYWASHMVDYLAKNSNLDKEVNINRFAVKRQN